MTCAYSAPSTRSAARSTGRTAATVGVLGALFCALSGLTGCQRALFPADLPRTQFETYDKMRQRYVPLEEPDVFGTPQPALRARLGQQN
jgi:hypothetical protein